MGNKQAKPDVIRYLDVPQALAGGEIAPGRALVRAGLQRKDGRRSSRVVPVAMPEDLSILTRYASDPGPDTSCAEEQPACASSLGGGVHDDF